MKLIGFSMVMRRASIWQSCYSSPYYNYLSTIFSIYSQIEYEMAEISEVKIFIRDFLVGGISASISVTAMAPLERIKLILQTQHVSIQITEDKRYKGLDCLT